MPSLTTAKPEKRHKWLALIASLFLGGPFSAVATFFIWRTSWDKKTKWVATVVATIIINLLCLAIIAVSSKILLSRGINLKILDFGSLVGIN